MGVLVAGAGPTGLTLACLLRAHGVEVRVVDAASGPATTSRALGLHRRGVEVLRRAGALGDLPSRAIGARTATVFANGRTVSRLPLVSLSGEYGPLLISQATIEAALRNRFTELGGTIEWNSRVTGLAQDRNGVTVTVGDTAVRADWVVGCDGAHSAVRRLAGIGFPGGSITERFALADVRLDPGRRPGDRTGTTAWLHPDGMVAAFPLPGEPADDLWRLMADLPPGDTEPDQDAVLAALRRAVTVRAGFEPAIIEARWVSMFRIHRRLAETHRAGRVLLAGDAAHIHSPFGGQGMNTGIGDAENLAWKLALVVRGLADPALLDSYQAERRPVAKEVLASTSTFTRLALSANPAVRLTREHLLPRLLRSPGLQRRALATASQLAVSYRNGPLGARTLVRPRPGDRVPDLDCLDRYQARTRLHDRLGTRWAVLAPSHVHAAEYVRAAAKKLGDDAVESLVPAGSGVDEVLLVRPDGHLAWRGNGRPDMLARWLEDALSTGRAR